MNRLTDEERAELERIKKAYNAKQEDITKKLGKTKAKRIIELLAKLRAEKGN